MKRITLLVLLIASFSIFMTGCGPKADEDKPITVTPTDATGATGGADQAGGGDFSQSGNGAITPGKEDVPTPGSQVNTPGNEMPADAK